MGRIEFFPKIKITINSGYKWEKQIIAEKNTKKNNTDIIHNILSNSSPNGGKLE